MGNSSDKQNSCPVEYRLLRQREAVERDVPTPGRDVAEPFDRTIAIPPSRSTSSMRTVSASAAVQIRGAWSAGEQYIGCRA